MRRAVGATPVGTMLAWAGGSRGGSAAASGDASVKEPIGASVQVTFAATVGALSEIPLKPKVIQEATGLVETEYFDLTPCRSEAERYPPVGRAVGLVTTVAPDTFGRGARGGDPHAVPAVHEGRGWTNERLVPRDHPGVTFTQEVLDCVERRALGRSR